MDTMTERHGIIANGKVNLSRDFPHQRAWDGNRIYFASTPLLGGMQKWHMSFGCFNIDTCEIEFIQDLPDKNYAGIQQMEAMDGRLYIRTSLNELYIYESDQKEQNENDIL